MPDADTSHATTDGTQDAHAAHDDGHGHGAPGEALGPVDAVTWGYALAGGLIGLLVVVGLFAAAGG